MDQSGEYRTNIVYSSPTVENADLITMTNSGKLKNIDVDVKWSDKYGNVYPIMLGHNKQVNIRYAFIKK